MKAKEIKNTAPREGVPLLRGPAYADVNSWVAGVLDSIGRFKIRWKDGRAVSASVYTLSTTKEIAYLLLTLTGGRVVATLRGNWTWECPPGEQLELMLRLGPYMRAQGDAVAKIMRFRMVAGVGPKAKPLTASEKAFRQSLT